MQYTIHTLTDNNNHIPTHKHHAGKAKLRRWPRVSILVGQAVNT